MSIQHQKNGTRIPKLRCSNQPKKEKSEEKKRSPKKGIKYAHLIGIIL